MSAIAVVTGASSGIGRATAQRLARDFSAVALVARDISTLNATADAVRAEGAEPLVIAADLKEAAAATDVVRQVVDRFGRVDALLNIAGAVPGFDLFKLTDAQWDDGWALKFHGARRLTLAAWDSLKESAGAVVFTSGVAAQAPTSAQAAVGTINAAIEALMKAFADAGKPAGIRVNAVSPGAVLTSRRIAMIERWAAEHAVGLDEARAALLKTAGIVRYGEPEEIGELMAFAVSPAARWMSGSVLRMDGGETRSV